MRERRRTKNDERRPKNGRRGTRSDERSTYGPQRNKDLENSVRGLISVSRCLCGGYVRSCFFVLGSLFVLASPAFAQLDPLLFLKNQQPNVVLVVETTNRMQRDADLTCYDPGEYNTGGSFSISSTSLQAIAPSRNSLRPMSAHSPTAIRIIRPFTNARDWSSRA